MKNYSLPFLLLLFSRLCFAQQVPDSEIIRPEIKSIVNGIVKDGVLKSERTGYGGNISDQWKRFECLSKLSTDNELFALSANKNSVVKCYAFQALLLRQNST